MHIYSSTTMMDLLRFVIEILKHENHSQSSKEKYSRVFFSFYKLIIKVSYYLIIFIYVIIV